MRLSIWHQFSSNHSASFTVVGQFDTVERAKEVETEMIEFLKEVQANYTTTYDEKPTRIELEYASKYGLEWEKRLEWIDFEFEDHVIRLDKHVFVLNGLSGGTFTPDRIENLMKSLTDHVIVESSEAGREETFMLTALTCQTPKNEVVHPIMQEIGTFLDECKSGESDVIIPPWDSYSHKSKYFANPVGVLGGEINQKGLNINLEIAFFDTQYGLPALVAYLKDKGCTDIEYSLSVVSYAKGPEYLK